MTYLSYLVAVVACLAWAYPPQPPERRPAPYDRIVLRNGQNPTLMVCTLCVLALCAATVAALAIGLLWGSLGIVSLASGYALLLEAGGGVTT